MRKLLVVLSVFVMPGLMGPEAIAFCGASVPMGHFVDSFFVCADRSEMSALAYQITDPSGTHTGTEDIACEAADQVSCFGMSGVLGDGRVTIETDWGNPGIIGCPIRPTGAERVVIVLQASDGRGLIATLGRGSFDTFGSYLVEAAHPYDPVAQAIEPLQCHDRTGRPRLVAQSANPGGTFTVVLHFEPPLVNTDCDPESTGVSFGACTDNFQPNSALGGVYTSVQACGGPADLRRASWTDTGVRPDANGDATITVTQPLDGRCLLIGGTSVIGGFESGAVTGFIQFDAKGCQDADADGFTNCQGDCDDGNAAIHPGATEVCNLIDDDCDGAIDEDVCDQSATDIFVTFTNQAGRGSGTVTWRTTHEVDVRGFNVVVITQQGERIQQNGTIIDCEQCRTGLGAHYTFVVPKHKSGRNIFIEVLHRDGSVATFGPAVRL